jgi:transposase
LGFEDETWWSRFEVPAQHAWTEAGHPRRLVEQPVAKDDPDPKALACYGLLLSAPANPEGLPSQIWLRFVHGRPVSAITTQFLDWCCTKLEATGKSVLLMVWDNASWHISREVRAWLRAHNQQVKRERRGVRLLNCNLPIKSPWLNPIEPHWIHAKRKVSEADRLLSARELRDRICDHFRCAPEPELAIPEKVA